ncbi:MAG: hypothetical protein WCF90_04775 [Methanomicrobiales archaeon]
MLRRAKSEIVFLFDEDAFFAQYRSDISRAAKRISVYLIVGRKEFAEFVLTKCYVGINDNGSSLFQNEWGETGWHSMKSLLKADRRESLTVV